MRPRSRHEQGAALLEFAISAGVFIFLLIITADVMRYSLATVKAQFIADRAIRDLVLQQHSAATARTAIKNRAARFGVTLSDAAGTNNIHLCSGQDIIGAAAATPPAFSVDCSNFNPCQGVAAEGSGGPRDLVTIHICYPFNFTLWGSMLPVTAHAIGRNEPF